MLSVGFFHQRFGHFFFCPYAQLAELIGLIDQVATTAFQRFPGIVVGALNGVQLFTHGFHTLSDDHQFVVNFPGLVGEFFSAFITTFNRPDTSHRAQSSQ